MATEFWSDLLNSNICLRKLISSTLVISSAKQAAKAINIFIYEGVGPVSPFQGYEQ